jgi:hypothetical protein
MQIPDMTEELSVTQVTASSHVVVLIAVYCNAVLMHITTVYLLDNNTTFVPNFNGL